MVCENFFGFFHGVWSLGSFLGHGVRSHLAIDIEFHVKEGQFPGVDLGTVDGKEVQEAIEYVLNLTAENGLPDKMVIVHQFAENVLFNNYSTHPTDNSEVVINFDGYGLDAIKRAKGSVPLALQFTPK